MGFPSSVDLATARVSAREYVGAGRAHALSLDVACIACPPQDAGAARDWLTPPMTIRHPPAHAGGRQRRSACSTAVETVAGERAQDLGSPSAPWLPPRGVAPTAGTRWAIGGPRRWDARPVSSERSAAPRRAAGGTPRGLPGMLP